jgi:hypothetical protein
MTKSITKFSRPALGIVASVFAFAAGQAWAAGPYLGGPSIMKVSQVGKFSGGNLTPVTAVKVLSKAPGGAELAQHVLVAANGKITYSVTPTVSGLHSLRIVDSAGKQLAATQFIAQ